MGYKTKRHKCKKVIVKEERRDWQVGGGDKRTESKSNQNAFYKHTKLSKHKLLNLVKQKRGIIGTHILRFQALDQRMAKTSMAESGESCS